MFSLPTYPIFFQAGIGNTLLIYFGLNQPFINFTSQGPWLPTIGGHIKMIHFEKNSIICDKNIIIETT